MPTIIIGLIVAFFIYRGIKATIKHDGCSSCSSCKGCDSASQCSSRH